MSAKSSARTQQGTGGGFPAATALSLRVPSLPTATRAARYELALLCCVGLAMLGLFARLMNFPIRHDEQMYLPVGVVLGQGDLYRDFGFNNFPNLPWLLHFVFGITGTTHYLLIGRLLVFGGWLLAVLATAGIAWRASQSRAVAAIAVLALVTSPLLLGAAGMIVSNNFLPIGFALLAILAFIHGVDRPVPDRRLALAAGLCVGIAAGFKANYIFMLPPFGLAALLLPSSADWRTRLRQVTGPFVLGGIVGGLPVLAYLLTDPAGFIAHTVNYHRGPQIAYWAANADLDGDKIMTLGGKLRLAETAWLSGPGLLLVLCLVMLAWAQRRAGVEKPIWPVLLVAGLLAGAVLVSFVPTPAFPQYYAAPIPLAIVLALLLYQRIDTAARVALMPLLRAVATLLLVLGAPRLLGDLPRLARPGQWTGIAAHAAGQRLAALVGPGKIATLAPIYPLEGGLALYPELAAGPLVYRVGDLIPAADRAHYARLVSPSTIGAVLARDPPAAILTGEEGVLDRPLIDYAAANGYSAVPLPPKLARQRPLTLHLRPPNG